MSSTEPFERPDLNQMDLSKYNTAFLIRPSGEDPMCLVVKMVGGGVETYPEEYVHLRCVAAAFPTIASDPKLGDLISTSSLAGGEVEVRVDGPELQQRMVAEAAARMRPEW